MADWEAFRKRHYELLGSAIVNNLNKKVIKPSTQEQLSRPKIRYWG